MLSLSSIADLSMVKGFADFLQTNHDHDNNTSDEDASNDEADFVEIIVAGIAVMRQEPAVPPLLPTTSTSMAVCRTTVLASALPLKKKRKNKIGSLMWTNPITGIANRLTPTMSHWYIYFIRSAPSQDHRFLCKFRRRLRLPYTDFQKPSAELEERKEFRPWWTGVTGGLGKPSTPIVLLVLTALLYNGQAWTLDDLSENACNGKEVVSFLHKFLRYASTVLYYRYVVSPSTEEEACNHMAENSDAGFPGAVGSTDDTHILLERVPNKHCQTHLCFKSSSKNGVHPTKHPTPADTPVLQRCNLIPTRTETMLLIPCCKFPKNLPSISLPFATFKPSGLQVVAHFQGTQHHGESPPTNSGLY